ncbi:ATP/GTP-binding protein [uncultured Methanofollis sp.]|uniref:GTP-binding protein n=1 Tax=uncultured Methanofollis sp. TaxID=262500 RepID=UPI00261DD2A7|nr:GTP-binding protein [uncultured Methanofollis sp.]
MAHGKFKLCVFGPYNAGKSSLIQCLDPAARHIEARCEGGTTTVALDYGKVQAGGETIYLFGTPGQERFEFVRQILARGMDGAIVVVDSTAGPDPMVERLSEWLVTRNVPYAIMLNKCDLPGSSPSRFARENGDAPVYLVSAKSGENVHEALSLFIQNLK